MPEIKFDFNKPEETKLQAEKEKQYISTTYIDLTRHGNRFGGPIKVTLNKLGGELLDVDDTQKLTPEGRRNSVTFGASSYSDTTLVHPRGGDELRHGQTGEDILKGSGKFGETRNVASSILYNDKEKGQRLKGARRGRGIDYASANLGEVLKSAKKLVNDTLQTLVDGLSEEEQLRFKTDPEYRAKLREQAQIAGLRVAMENEEMTKKLAENEAFELMHDVELSRRGIKKEKPKTITLVGSGLFAESLFKYALVVEDPQTGTKKVGFENVDEVGGFTKQASAFRIKLTRDNSKGDARNLGDFDKDTRVECEFIADPERSKLFEGKHVCLDWNIVRQLSAKARSRFEQNR